MSARRKVDLSPKQLRALKLIAQGEKRERGSRPEWAAPLAWYKDIWG